MISLANYADRFKAYLCEKTVNPFFLQGDTLTVLREFPDDCIDFCMTSPPYWGKRQYHGGGIGLETEWTEYIDRLAEIFKEVKRVLKSTGSFWLNIGDTYSNKELIGIPWRLSLKLMDEQGWILRNSVIWNKIKGGLDNTTDRLRNVHENIFHFVKHPTRYYYDVGAIRSNPKKSKVVNGAIVSATGVRGVRYRRQIELSTALSENEKKSAMKELQLMLDRISRNEIADFRMIIRGQQRVTHSDSEAISGRARELQEKGFYFLKYHPLGSKPSDVWDILPEDTQNRNGHFAPYPEELCIIPILATCPPDGIVLDPFCGTGTTMFASRNQERKSIGIDICSEYIKIANERCIQLI